MNGAIVVRAVSGANVVVVADPAAAAEAAAERIARVLADAVARRGRADWATTGGSTPAGIYRRLTDPALGGEVPWQAVQVWWGDDRYVPRDHPASNVKALDDILIGVLEGDSPNFPLHRGVPLPVGNVHPFRTAEAIGSGAGAAWCAEALADELRAANLEQADGWPVFDLMLLGLGPDGHVLSVFPGSPALDSDALTLAVPAPTHIEPHIERVTLNPAVVGVAREVLMVVIGADKAAAVAEVLGPSRDPRRWPGQLAVRPNATWILDAEAASALPG
jgi:6-phosphogluconolactonase